LGKGCPELNAPVGGLAPEEGGRALRTLSPFSGGHGPGALPRARLPVGRVLPWAVEPLVNLSCN